ncbi:hypothetical protein RHMOL_Rhmol01G0246000 [Rhododendron molle]|uniref:Uncharacterized protein n=1 Tax=Rhododendron molle TaxID=49168 RepID=A0ACC0Q861_RHOML|nr:hypothetical protein RHMOL_Rhmol01G0246000 [Rhododendron molle]
MRTRDEVPRNAGDNCPRGLEVLVEMADPTLEGGLLGVRCRCLAGPLSIENGAILGQFVQSLQPLDVLSVFAGKFGQVQDISPTEG